MSENNPPEVPAAPTTPAEAKARMDSLMATEAWAKGWMAGSPAHIDEFNKLLELSLSVKSEKIDPDDPAGAAKQIFLDSQQRDNANTAGMLRDSGITDPAIIKQVLTNEEVSQQEFDAAHAMRSRLEKDHDWQKKFLSGDGEAVRQMMLLNIILTRPVKRGAAA
jgi:hypothetical protein